MTTYQDLDLADAWKTIQVATAELLRTDAWQRLGVAWSQIERIAAERGVSAQDLIRQLTEREEG